MDTCCREYTIHLATRVHGKTFKKKAPTAVKKVKEFAQKMMGTSDVRVDTRLNKALWAGGIRSTPKRIRVQIERRRADDEDAKEEFYSYVTHVEGDFRGQGVKVIE